MSQFVQSLEARRLFAFGDLDTSFSGDAIAVDDPSVTVTQIKALAEGRLVGLAQTDSGAQTLRVYKADGTLDTAFSGDGVVEFSTTGRVLEVIPVARDKIVVLTAFRDTSTGRYRLELSRYKTDGNLDRTAYGTNGTVVVAQAPDTLAGVRVVRDGTGGDLYVIAADLFDSSASPSALGSSTVSVVNATGESYSTYPLSRLPSTTDNDGNTLAYNVSDGVRDNPGGLFLTGVRHRYSTVQVGDETTLSDAGAELFAIRLTPRGALDTAFGTGGVKIRTDARVLSDQPQIVLGGGGTPTIVFRGSKTSQNADYINVWEPVANVFNARSGANDLFNPTDVQSNFNGGFVVFGNRGRTDNREGLTARLTETSSDVWTLGPVVSLSQQGIEANDGGMITGTLDSQARIVGAGRGRYEGNGNNSLGKNDPQYHLSRLTTGTVGETRGDEITNAQQNSITYDSNGNLHVFYYDVATENLKYRLRTSAGRWQATETVDPAQFAGTFLSGAVMSDGTPAVAYFDGNAGDLKYAFRFSNGVWGQQTVDSKGSTGSYPSLKFSDDDRPYVSYYNRTKNELRLAALTTEGSFAIDAIAPGGRSTSLDINPFTNRFAIAYEGSLGDVMLAERVPKSSVWQLTRVATTTGGVGSLDLGFEKYGNKTSQEFAPTTIVSYYDAGPANLVIARRLSTGTTFSNTTVDSSGTTGLTPVYIRSGEVIDRVYYYDRTANTVQGADPGQYGTTTLTPRIDNPPYYTGGGRFFTADVTGPRQYKTFAFLDNASNKLFVRDYL